MRELKDFQILFSKKKQTKKENAGRRFEAYISVFNITDENNSLFVHQATSWILKKLKN